MIAINPINNPLSINPQKQSIGVENNSTYDVSICPEFNNITIDHIENVVILGGDTAPERRMIILTVTEIEILAGTNRVVRKNHGLNVALVDVSVFDHNNNEVAVGVTIVNPNEVDIDFTRANIPLDQEWSILIEA